MVEEKTEKHEHEQAHEVNEAKTVTMKKSTLWAMGSFVLLVLLVISVFTGGFGIMKPTGNAANTGNNANAGAGGATGPVDLKFITSNPDLYFSLGPKNAKVTVIELSDFQCPYCAIASGLPSWTEQYKSQYGELVGAAGNIQTLAEQGKVRFIYVNLNFLGAESTYASQAAMCAQEQGKFWEMHDAIFTAHDSKEGTGKYTKDKLEVLAKSISGLDQAKFKTCLESDATLSKVQQIMTEVQKAGIQIGTPQFFVNGKAVQASSTALQSAINAA